MAAYCAEESESSENSDFESDNSDDLPLSRYCLEIDEDNIPLARHPCRRNSDNETDMDGIGEIVSDESNDDEAFDSISSSDAESSADSDSDHGQIADPNNFAWSSNLVSHGDLNFDQATVGPTDPQLLSPIQLFCNFFTDYILQDIVTQTNLYADQCREDGNNKVAWDKITLPELKSWLGLLLAMGIVEKKGRTAEYWTKHWLLQTPGFATTMSSRRFLTILRYIHFVDNRDPTIDKNYKLWKIQPLITYLTRRFQRVYRPRCQIAIDETMIKFKGRLKIKQYIQNKPTKWGIKLFTLAESKTGYVLNVIPYAGKRADTDVSKTTQTVMDVLEPYLRRGHHLFMDNYYTSVELMKRLEQEGTLSCGTVRSNRKGLPAEKMKKTAPAVKKLKRGESITLMQGRMAAVTWKDSRVVNLLTNLPGPQVLGDTEVQRREKTKDGVREFAIKKPVAINTYNTYMGGVDLSDQRVSTYRRHMKSLTWYLQIFYHFLRLSVVQAFIIYKELNPGNKIDQKNFTTEVIDGLVAGRSFIKKKGRPFSSVANKENIRFQENYSHAPQKLETGGQSCVKCIQTE
ncbi:PREDICTED: piggyBac transposable element-derived protein 4-like [Priapulus caudatus]|uniref:PiggyBac transposable element-derived protein 4-like n=1 Tax=Priapulus caudatus TaxID=37621 RepID=A0ABM1F8T2_PRICU|nr:PREDICTED: piggyBac transposable element-derived protein 4-like [Priapulus caudatus]